MEASENTPAPVKTGSTRQYCIHPGEKWWWEFGSTLKHLKDAGWWPLPQLYPVCHSGPCRKRRLLRKDRRLHKLCRAMPPHLPFPDRCSALARSGGHHARYTVCPTELATFSSPHAETVCIPAEFTTVDVFGLPRGSAHSHSVCPRGAQRETGDSGISKNITSVYYMGDITLAG